MDCTFVIDVRPRKRKKKEFNKGFRYGVCMPFAHGAFRTTHKLKYLDFFCGNRISISAPLPCAHLGVGYGVCVTLAAGTLLFRHIAYSAS